MYFFFVKHQSKNDFLKDGESTVVISPRSTRDVGEGEGRGVCVCVGGGGGGSGDELVSYVAFILSLFFFIFLSCSASGRLCFMIMAFPGNLHLYFCAHN